MQSTDTAEVSLLESLLEEMRRDLGPDSFFYRTEVKGQIECAEPLQSELSNTNCIYYNMVIKHEYEERYTTREGNQTVQKTRKGSERVAGNSRSTPFYLVDATGKVLIDPANAEFIDETLLSHFEPARSSGSREVKIGSFRFTMPEQLKRGDRTTLGYSFTETAIPVNANLYILGEATDRNGKVVIAKPRQDGKLVISSKSEEQLMSEAIKSMRLSIAGAVVALLAGIGLIVADLMEL